MYLGPLVASQQVLDPSPHTSYPWKERKGDTSPATKSSRGQHLGSPGIRLPPQDIW